MPVVTVRSETGDEDGAGKKEKEPKPEAEPGHEPQP